MSVRKLKQVATALFSMVLVSASSHAWADSHLNLREGVTEVSRNAYSLHMIVLWVCVAIGVVVFGAMIYSMFAHRKSKGAVAASFHESHKVEILWTVIPFIILIALAIPATKDLLLLEDASNSDMTVKVTGYQWKWRYEYMDGDAEGVKFFSSLDKASNDARAMNSGIDVTKVPNYLQNVDNELVIPAGKKVRFLITSNDVIHSWWMPDFGFKKDALPGYINEAWTRVEQPGTYRGKCAELCGKDHGFMPIVVVVKEEDEYKKWAAAKKAEADTAAAAAASDKTWSKVELMAKGATVYGTNCAACHQANGEGTGPFPALKASAIAIGPAADHIGIVVNGSKTNPLMAAYGAQLNDLDLAAVITYERNSWGNEASIVQPKDIKAAR